MAASVLDQGPKEADSSNWEASSQGPRSWAASLPGHMPKAASTHAWERATIHEVAINPWHALLAGLGVVNYIKCEQGYGTYKLIPLTIATN